MASVLSRKGASDGDGAVVERPAALDVHQAQLRACVRVSGAKGKRVEEFAKFKTTMPDLLRLADWLEALGVKQVAMEGTGVYWRSVYDDSGGPVRADARQRSAREERSRGGRPIPGTPQWLCQLLRTGCCARASCHRARSARSGT